MDLCLGAIDTTIVNRKRGRERKTIRKVPSNFKYNKYYKGMAIAPESRLNNEREESF